jgi:S-methylmethionine-dependent homocysteine/selenocysteine methylase
MTITVLDGGMGRELARMGAPFQQPEWSALALLEGPEWVARAHRSFVDAGADVITTNSYAVVPFHLGEERFAVRGRELADLAGRLAREVADDAPRPVLVAGSLPPLFGSYRPDLFDPERAPALAFELVRGLAPWVDVWLAETQGAIVEAETAAAALAAAGDTRPLWVSFTVSDGEGPPRLRSGEPVAAAVARAVELGATAVLFNCSQPERMAAAIVEARSVCDLPLGAYANAFPPMPEDHEANDVLLDIRTDLDPAGYRRHVESWLAAGATMVGGCCGIGPEHIAALAALRDARRV